MYDLQILTEVLRDDYGVFVQGIDSDGIYIADSGENFSDLERYMKEITMIEDGFAGMQWRVYNADDGFFMEIW
jgi:hypothetical protein